MNKFSVVMPIHNEEKYLSFSLPSIFKLNPDEIILIFDSCTDRSLELSRKIAQHFGIESRIKFMEYNDIILDWNYRVAFLFRYGYKHTVNDIILTMAADVIFVDSIVPYFNKLSENVKLVSFGLKHYPLNIQYFIRKLICLFFPRKGFSGVFIFSKSAWLETEDEESVKKIIKGQDTHLSLSIQKKYSTQHIWTNGYDLRPNENPKEHYLKGIAYRQFTKKSFLELILSSLVYLRPMMIAGYLHSSISNTTSKESNTT